MGTNLPVCRSSLSFTCSKIENLNVHVKLSLHANFQLPSISRNILLYMAMSRRMCSLSQFWWENIHNGRLEILNITPNLDNTV